VILFVKLIKEGKSRHMVIIVEKCVVLPFHIFRYLDLSLSRSLGTILKNYFCTQNCAVVTKVGIG